MSEVNLPLRGKIARKASNRAFPFTTCLAKLLGLDARHFSEVFEISEEVRVVQVVFSVNHGILHLLFDVSPANGHRSSDRLDGFDQRRFVQDQRAVLDVYEEELKGQALQLVGVDLLLTAFLHAEQLFIDRAIEGARRNPGEVVAHRDQRVHICLAVDVGEEVAERHSLVNLVLQVFDDEDFACNLVHALGRCC